MMSHISAKEYEVGNTRVVARLPNGSVTHGVYVGMCGRRICVHPDGDTGPWDDAWSLSPDSVKLEENK